MPESEKVQFQHHLPRFYLKGWATTVQSIPKRIWIYERGKSPRCSAIKTSAGRENMYSVVRSDGSLDIETVEKYLAKSESKAGTVFPRIFRRQILEFFEKHMLASFISIMARRDTYTFDAFAPANLPPLIPGFHKKMRDDAYRISDPKLRKNYIDEVRKAIERAGDNINSLTSQAILESEPLARYMSNEFNWSFLYSKTANFVTSDAPVVINRSKGIRSFSDGHVLFPISRNILLWMTRWPISDRLYFPVSDRVVSDLNVRLIKNAFREVYAITRSDEIQDLVDRFIGDGLPLSTN
jgi:hypothetical protein